MKSLIILLTGLVFLSIACGNASQQKEKEPTGAIAGSETIDTSYFPAGHGLEFAVAEDNSLGASLSRIKVFLKGNPENTIDAGEKDPIINTLVADLDGNDTNEVYIITQAAGSGSYGTILPFTLDGQQQLRTIALPEITDADKGPGGRFEGYDGHDSIFIAENRLKRTFPVPGSPKEENSVIGQRKLISYMLTPAGLEYAKETMTGADRDSHGCIGATGYTWSELQQECIRLFERATRLNANGEMASKAEAAYIFFNADQSKAELWLPGKKGSILLERKGKEGGHSWENGQLKLYPWKGYILKDGEKLIYAGG
ncbi:hypothetical protein KJS94_05940 [Flavihumibacter rivuli]|uniref:hypothetical protein n=1 Tax=Flavihumibacter rivuli TaxID=2838156 RepID=UPI001BDE841B|nr:hypothetical protein [Flavihumibacter rivuli]ULQ57738.1 hypothetical protein KJS94_05940 [Flavihumibacter rivuli]